jgi:hypothetical protein
MQYPSAVTVSNAVVLSGSDFSANFYSLLNPGSEVRYAFSGCTSDELNATSLTGTVTAPYGTVTKRFTRANYAIFPTVVPQTLTISCGAPLPVTTYAVTVSGDNLFYINELRQLPTMTAGNVYLFDQSNNSNIGNTLVFGSTLDSTSYYTTGVFTNGTAGSDGAYTLLNYTDATQSGLNYYSRQNSGMGYEPAGYTATGTYSSTNGGSLHTVTFTSTGSIRISSADTSVSVLVVGAGGKGGDCYQNNYGGSGGGGGGIIYNDSYSIGSGSTYDIVVGESSGNRRNSSFGGTIMIGNGGGSGYIGRNTGQQISGGSGGSGSGSGSVRNGGIGGGITGSSVYVAGGGATSINSIYYSGGGQCGNIKGGASSPTPNNTSTTSYGTGGKGGNGANFNTTGDVGKNGVVIIKFTLVNSQ